MHADEIVIIDDDVDYSYLLQLAFSEVGVINRIELIHDSCAAIAYFKQFEPESLPSERASPALVVLDLRMPKIGGLEMLRWIRGEPNLMHIPVAVFTGVEAHEELSEVIAVGASSIHVKPFSYRELVESARSLRDKYLGHPALEAAA